MSDIYSAVLEGDGASVKQFADADSTVINTLAEHNGQNVAPLQVAARHGLLEMAALLYGLGADLELRDDEHQCTALGWAAYFGQTEMAEMLIRFGANVEDRCRPVELAKSQGHPETVKLLQQYGAPEYDE